MDSQAENRSGPAIASRLDFAYLRLNSQTTVEGLRAAADLTMEFGFRSICVHPVLAGTVKKNYPRLRVCAVVAYPLGVETLAAKVFVINELAELGVDEVDFVVDLFAMANSNWDKVRREVTELGEQCMKARLYSKAIIETPILSDDRIRMACELILSTPIPCIKTSTGYNREPTSVDHVKLIRDTVGREKMIKASGGISTYDEARVMIQAGADIIGTSRAAVIVEEASLAEQPVE